MRLAAAKLYDNNEVVFVFVEEAWGRMSEKRMAYSELKGYHQVDLELVETLKTPGLGAWYIAFQEMKKSVDCSNITVLEGAI